MLQSSMKKLHEKRRTGEGGFTLVELLIVIVILGILAAIVVLAIGGLNTKSKAAACSADAKTIETADEAYYASTGVNTNYSPDLNTLMVTEKLIKNDATLAAKFTVTAPAAGTYAITGIGDCTGTALP